MSGVDYGVAGQGEHLLFYILYECRVVAVCKVGAADAALEQYVARKDCLFFGDVVSETAG